jgi:predicted nucleotidyltransferase
MALHVKSPSFVSAVATPAIREDVLRDPRYPVHRIADRLLPYLRVLIEQFQPQQVILFGSYAYGQPDEHSDLDLLVVKDVHESVLKDKVQIRRAWWKMPRLEPLLPFDLILVSPQRHRERLESAGGFYDEIIRRGLKLV